MESFAFVKLEDDDTSELLACRVCLDTESKLFDLHRNGSAVIFGELTGTQVSKRDGLPQYICSICKKLLHKSFTFRTKCRQAHVLLQDARVREPFMTTSHIRTLDRSKFKHKFSYTNALNISIPAEKDINVELEEPSIDKNHEENHLVKSESLIYSDDEMLNDFHESIDHLDIYIGEKDTQVELERSIITKKIDEQNENLLMKSDTLTYCGDEILNDFNKSIDNLDTDINLEFPAISQENLQDTIIKDNEQEKQKFQEIKKEVIKKRAKKKTPAKQKEREPKPKKVRQKKRKRPCNMKFIEDFAEFNETYNCEVLFLTKEQQLKEVEERKESELFKKGRFQCMICFKGFMNDNAHGKHMILHNESSGDHICEVCQARFDSRKRYLAHNRLHKYRFVCKICDHISKSSYLAKAHFKWHEGIKYECKDCNKKYNTVSTYFNHKRSYHAPVTCEICNATVSGTKGLEEHSEKMHSTTKHPCATCKTKFESQEAFDRHLNPDKICFRYLSIPCTKCGERFSNEQMLYKHTESSHGDTVFKCEECHAVFRTDRRLAAHWSLRHSQHYMCEVCAKTFSSECLLQEHQRLHTGEKPFPCPMCPKRFRQKIHLRVHINTHTGERPFKCAHCEDTFKSYSQRHKHILMVHKKERRHKCHMCEKTYVVSFDLKMHIRTYHMKIPLPPPNRKKSRRKQQ